MTDEKAIEQRNKNKARIDYAARRAIFEAAKRLQSITDKDRDDNRAFDRAARTALTFLRIAETADLLAARLRKEDAENEQGVQVRLPTLDEIERIERAIDEAVDRSNDDRAGRSAAAGESARSGDHPKMADGGRGGRA